MLDVVLLGSLNGIEPVVGFGVVFVSLYGICPVGPIVPVTKIVGVKFTGAGGSGEGAGPGGEGAVGTKVIFLTVTDRC